MNKQYAFSFDGNDYSNGIFNSVDEALKEAREIYPKAKSVWVGEAIEPELRWSSNEEEIIDSMMDNLYDDCGEFADCFGVTTDIEINLGKMIDETVKQWIKKYDLKPNCFNIVNSSIYEL